MNFKSIITHGGIFHADDVCAVAYLRMLGCKAQLHRRNPTDSELQDPEVLVADVGGQLDKALSNFDHHQKGGAGARWDSDVPYAAFGLIYDQVIRPTDEDVGERFEGRVVKPVDATDCGWGTREGTRPELSFSACVAGFNPGTGASAVDRDAAFEKAVDFASQVLANEMKSAEDFVAAKTEVLEARAHGEVLVLEKFVPWAEHVFSRGDHPELLYVVFPSERGGWMVQQIAKELGSFEGRKSLPEAWAGLRGEELAKLTGLSTHGDATFCHPGRFVAGAENREDAMVLAGLAVEA